MQKDIREAHAIHDNSPRDDDDEIAILLSNGVRLLPEKRVIVDKSGAEIPLTENSYRFLLLLLQGETDKQNIINQVWHEQAGAVSDSSYYGQIHTLRKSFEQLGLSVALIKTIPRKGVKYMGKVQFPAEKHTQAEGNIAPQLSIVSSAATEEKPDNTVYQLPPSLSGKPEWYNSRSWNTLITVLAVLAVCWLTTLIVAGFYFFLH